jgi:hypothetical protein
MLNSGSFAFEGTPPKLISADDPGRLVADFAVSGGGAEDGRLTTSPVAASGKARNISSVARHRVSIMADFKFASSGNDLGFYRQKRLGRAL